MVFKVVGSGTGTAPAAPTGLRIIK